MVIPLLYLFVYFCLLPLIDIHCQSVPSYNVGFSQLRRRKNRKHRQFYEIYLLGIILRMALPLVHAGCRCSFWLDALPRSRSGLWTLPPLFDVLSFNPAPFEDRFAQALLDVLLL